MLEGEGDFTNDKQRQEFIDRRQAEIEKHQRIINNLKDHIKQAKTTE